MCIYIYIYIKILRSGFFLNFFSFIIHILCFGRTYNCEVTYNEISLISKYC